MYDDTSTPDSDWLEKSTFNQALHYIARLDALQKAANQCAVEENYYGWFLVLKTLYRSLHPRLKKQSAETEAEGLDTEEIKKCELLLTELKQIAFEYKKLETNSRLAGRQVMSALPSKFCHKLEMFETYLLDCINTKGLLLPVPSDDEGL